MNAMQSYPHIIELFACVLKIFALIFIFSTKSLIYSGKCSTQKLSK